MDLKDILKKLKLNESTISMVLGAVVIMIVGILVVNYFKSDKEGETLITDTEITEESETPEEGSKYVVQKGDTLWSISEKAYGTGFEWQKIAEANQIQNDQLEEGIKLEIPNLETAMVAEDKESEEIAEETSEEVAEMEDTEGEITEEQKVEPIETEIEGEVYTVVKGDNLWKIAERAYGSGYKWTEIAKTNELVNPNLIHAGNVLKLPR